MPSDLTVRLTCPACEQVNVETMPTDSCVVLYECPKCQTVLSPRPGDCCVFCSYGDKPCPFVQDQVRCPDAAS